MRDDTRADWVVQAPDAPALDGPALGGDVTCWRIVLVDDHVVMRAGTRRILEDEPDLCVVGEAGDGIEALGVIGESVPDVVLLDIGMPRLDGIRTCRELRRQFPGMRIVILTGHVNDAYVRALYRLGVDGYLLKSSAPDELVAAIRGVCRGEQIFGVDTARILAHGGHAEELRLTRKEVDVLRALAAGLKNREMAEALHMSVNTVEYHFRNLFSKLDVTTRTEALVRAQNLGWLNATDPLS